MSEQHAAARAGGEEMKPDPDWQAAAAQVAERGGAALDAGVAPGSPEAEAIVADSCPPSARPTAPRSPTRSPPAPTPRAERYWQLLAIINGWPPIPTTVPAWEWFIAALRG